MGYEPRGEAMSEAVDWRTPATLEYRAKRADLQKRLSAAARAEQRAAERRADLETQLNDLDAGARAFGLETSSVPETAAPPSGGIGAAVEGGSPLVREIIMSALEAAYPKGLRAKQLKAIIEQRLGREIHYKTPGMTLYRLETSQDVRREGYDWFLANPPARFVPGHDEPHPFVVDPDEQDEQMQHEPDPDREPDWDWEQYQEDRMTGG
jgi:hypothetical protein